MASKTYTCTISSEARAVSSSTARAPRRPVWPDAKQIRAIAPRHPARKYLLKPAYGHEAFVIEIVSTFHPGRAVASSVPMRKRSLMVCPLTLDPRFITLLM